MIPCARRRFGVVVTCSATSAGSAELLEQMEYLPRSPDNSAAASCLGSPLAVLGGLVVLTVAVALPLAVAQTADRRQEV